MSSLYSTNTHTQRDMRVCKYTLTRTYSGTAIKILLLLLFECCILIRLLMENWQHTRIQKICFQFHVHIHIDRNVIIALVFELSLSRSRSLSHFTCDINCHMFPMSFVWTHIWLFDYVWIVHLFGNQLSTTNTISWDETVSLFVAELNEMLLLLPEHVIHKPFK